MKSHTEYLTLNLPSKMAFLNITPQVEEARLYLGVGAEEMDHGTLANLR